jgi:hypothetical protein
VPMPKSYRFSPIVPEHSGHLKCRCLQQQVGNILEDSLWWFNITIEPEPCIADLPINLMIISNSYVKSSEGSHVDEGWWVNLLLLWGTYSPESWTTGSTAHQSTLYSLFDLTTGCP